MGLLLTGDLLEAIRIVAWEEMQKVIEFPVSRETLAEITSECPAVRDLLTFHVSTTHLALRKKLGLSVLSE
jgi:hypothetical protein